MKVAGKVALKIALLTYATKPRGSVMHTLELAEALQELGHAVTVFALDKDGRGFERSLTCRVALVPAKAAPSEIETLIRQRIQEFVDYFEQLFEQLSEAYDCYHAQDCIGANALAELRQRGRIAAFVRTVHHIEEYHSPYLQACQERSILEPDVCLCVSDYWQTQLQQRYRIQASRVINGVNVQRFSAQMDGTEAELKQRLGLHSGPIYLTVGGIEPRKNSIALLQAFAQIVSDIPGAQLVIAGGATLFDYQAYRDAFFAEVQRLQIEMGRSLILPGVIADADLPSLYRSADVFVFPSVKEGWGLVVLEAIASGLPVITANQPPFTEFLAPDRALFVNPHSVHEIAVAMQTATQSDISQALVQTSQAILNDYSWQLSAQQHVDHYFQFI